MTKFKRVASLIAALAMLLALAACGGGGGETQTTAVDSDYTFVRSLGCREGIQREENLDSMANLVVSTTTDAVNKASTAQEAYQNMYTSLSSEQLWQSVAQLAVNLNAKGISLTDYYGTGYGTSKDAAQKALIFYNYSGTQISKPSNISEAKYYGIARGSATKGSETIYMVVVYFGK